MSLDPTAFLLQLLSGNPSNEFSSEEFPPPFPQLIGMLQQTPPIPALREVALQQAIISLDPSQFQRLRLALIEHMLRTLNGILTPRQREVLAVVLTRGPIQIRAVAALLAQNPGTIHRRLQSLVSFGLIERLHQNGLIYYRLARRDDL